MLWIIFGFFGFSFFSCFVFGFFVGFVFWVVFGFCFLFAPPPTLKSCADKARVCAQYHG